MSAEEGVSDRVESRGEAVSLARLAIRAAAVGAPFFPLPPPSLEEVDIIAAAAADASEEIQMQESVATKERRREGVTEEKQDTRFPALSLCLPPLTSTMEQKYAIIAEPVGKRV